MGLAVVRVRRMREMLRRTVEKCMVAVAVVGVSLPWKGAVIM